MKGNRVLVYHLMIACIFLLLSCESAVMREFNTLMAGNNTQATKQMLNEVLSDNPGDAEANYLMGNILMRERNYGDAKIYFDHSLNTSSMYREHIEYMMERSYRIEVNEAISSYSDERYHSAIQSIKQAKSIHSDRIEVYRLLGRLYKKTDQVEEAKLTYKACLNLEAENRECGINLAVLYKENENYVEAIDLSKKFLEYYPDDYGFKKNLVYTYFEGGDFDRAEESFDELLQISFRYATLKQFANELNNRGEIYRAEKYYRRCLERRPMDQEVLSALSYIYMETGNFRLMVEANERLLISNPNDISLKKNLMLSYELHGDIDKYRAMREELGLD
ncbi:hypothetical protein QLX67_06440 [Balneolaceae bacterium ANBcel3]|nr:hypothetical protein [Balneolaceae bacterium ANBcel3]